MMPIRLLQKSGSLFTTLVLAAVLCLGNGVEIKDFALIAAAQDGETGTASEGSGEGSAPAQGSEDTDCRADLEAFLSQAEPEYRAWLETHFQNKSSTTSLLDEAFVHYAQYRKRLFDKYALYFPDQGALQVQESIELGACFTRIEQSLEMARWTLSRKALSTSAVKKSTALLQKYKTINDRLSTLNQNVVIMKKYLDTFADKLPCYLARGCNKG